MPELISIVIPMHNEFENVEPLWQRLVAVWEGNKRKFEVIFVDDGSTDHTFKALSALHARDPRAKVLRLSRNFGHQGALRAGLEKANGDAIIMMDGDLQHPPEVIPKLIAAWDEGFEVVHSQRTYDQVSFKQATSKAFYRILSKLSPVPIRPGMADFRLIDKRVKNYLSQYPEYEIFYRGLIPLLGLRQTFIHYTANLRHGGKTKYTLLPMIRLAINGITSLSTMPLYFGVILGGAISGLSLLYGIYALVAKFYWGDTISGWTSLILSVLLIGGMQMILLGLIGVYIAKIFLEVKKRPPYLIEETLE